MLFDHTFHFLNSPKQWFVSKTCKKKNKKKNSGNADGYWSHIKSPLCTMSKSFGDGTYDAKKTRVNSGLLYAVFLLPNLKFSQLNALAWTSSSPPP